jgi:acetate kinase
VAEQTWPADGLNHEAATLELVQIIVHGGMHFATPVRVDDGLLAQLDTLVPLAPLHNLAPIRTIAAHAAHHLGNGASACAIQMGRSVASTMGFTAVDGLMMGTRCGAIDPGVLIYLMDTEGMDARGLEDLIYRKSGLLLYGPVGHQTILGPNLLSVGLSRCYAMAPMNAPVRAGGGESDVR